jgi:peptide/nickel transport system ATP-binding protein
MIESRPREEPAILSVSDLSVTLQRRGIPTRVLDQINFRARAGEIVALLGESGSGKSTLGLAILGLLAPESRPLVSGSIKIERQEVVGAAASALRPIRRRVGTVFQDPIGSLNPTMRIGRQLEEIIEDGKSPAWWLAQVGIPDPDTRLRSFPHQLSGGQCQRVMIAMAMARHPSLIIADEPTTALDVVVQGQVLALLRRLARENGVAMVFVTHDLAVAAALADRVAVLHAGRLIEEGPAAQLVAHPAHPYSATLLAARFGLAADCTRQLPIALPGARGRSSGCHWAPRCTLTEDRCRERMPAPTGAPHGGWVACHRGDELATATTVTAGAPWPEPRQVVAGHLLELVGISKTFRLRHGAAFAGRQVFHALDGVALRVARGEAVAVVGGSGSGKSTLLRIAAGLLAPDEGDVAYAGKDRPQIVFQDAAGSFTPWLTIGEQIGERLRPTGLSRAERSDRVARALERVGLDPGYAAAKVANLSGGQCQRAALARAIVVPPNLLLCDEAVSAMDMSLAATILNLIGVLRRELGMALLFVTHDLAAARFLADRIVVMEGGRVVESGPAEDVIRNPAHPATQLLLEAMPDRLAVTAT